MCNAAIVVLHVCVCRDGAAPTPPNAQLAAPEPPGSMPAAAAGEGRLGGRQVAGGKLAVLGAVGAQEGKKARRPLGQVTNSKGGAASGGTQRAPR